MTWVKLDDQWPNHPKMLTVGPLAQLLHVRALCYCAQYLTDGAIPHAAVVSLVDWRTFGIREGCADDGDDRATVEVDSIDLAERLVSVGAWEVTETGYVIHDYLEYQRSREQVLAERKSWTARQGRKRTAVTGGVTPGVTGVVTPGVTGVVTALSRTCHARPDPVPDPDPIREDPEQRARKKARKKPDPKPETPLPLDWIPTSEHRLLANRLGADLDREAIAFRGHAESHGRTAVSWNGAFSTWLAKSRPSPQCQPTAQALACREPFMLVGAVAPKLHQTPPQANVEPTKAVQ